MTLYPFSNIFNIKDFGAVGDGVTDDTVAIQDAINACAAVPGGTVFVPTATSFYKLNTAGTSVSALYIGASNIQIIGEGYGSLLKSTLASQGVFYISGSILGAGGNPATASSFTSQLATTYTINPVSKSSNTITCSTAANASNFATGDYVYIRTGQCNGNPSINEPDAEINKVLSVDTNTGIITLAWPLTKDYAQEYFITGTNGRTSTSVTANPAILGVAKITDRIITGVMLDNLNIQSANAQATIGLNQITNFRMRNNHMTTQGTGLATGDMRFVWVEKNKFHITGSGTVSYAVNCGKGSSDINVVHNNITSERVSGIVFVEGCSRVNASFNTIESMASNFGSDYSIAFQTRTYGARVIGNHLVNAGGAIALYVDNYCPGGGMIDKNIIEGGNFPSAISVGSPGWVIGYNEIQAGGVYTYAGGTSGKPGPVEQLSGWLGSSITSSTIGVLPAGSQILNVYIDVQQGFNGTGTNNVTVGNSISATAYVTGTVEDWSSTGRKTATPGTSMGRYTDVDRSVLLNYTGTGPTTGKALVTVVYARIPRIIS